MTESLLTEAEFRNCYSEAPITNKGLLESIEARMRFTASCQDAKTRTATLKEVGEWLDGPCPHGTKAADTSDASRRECYECWQAFLRGEMPEVQKVTPPMSKYQGKVPPKED